MDEKIKAVNDGKDDKVIEEMGKANKLSNDDFIPINIEILRNLPNRLYRYRLFESVDLGLGGAPSFFLSNFLAPLLALNHFALSL